MPTTIYIRGRPAAVWGRGRDSLDGAREFEDALWRLVGQAGEVLDPDEHCGPGLEAGVVLWDGTDVVAWVERLVAFLRAWGVPGGASLSVTTGEGAERRHRRVEVASD